MESPKVHKDEQKLPKLDSASVAMIREFITLLITTRFCWCLYVLNDDTPVILRLWSWLVRLLQMRLSRFLKQRIQLSIQLINLYGWGSGNNKNLSTQESSKDRAQVRLIRACRVIFLGA